jgi:hypothetical protein
VTFVGGIRLATLYSDSSSSRRLGPAFKTNHPYAPIRAAINSAMSTTTSIHTGALTTENINKLTTATTAKPNSASTVISVRSLPLMGTFVACPLRRSAHSTLRQQISNGGCVTTNAYSPKCLEKLSEKGFEKRSEHGFGRHKESEGAGKSLLGGPQSCTIDAFGAFRTVSRR